MPGSNFSRQICGAVSVTLRPGTFVKLHRLVVVAQLDADLGEDAVGGGFDLRQAFVGQDVIGRDSADDVGTVDARFHTDAGVAHLLPPAALPLAVRDVAVRHDACPCR